MLQLIYETEPMRSLQFTQIIKFEINRLANVMQFFV